jgi:hypothetical protein
VVAQHRYVLIAQVAAQNALEPRPVLQRQLDLDGDDLIAVTSDKREVRPVESLTSVLVAADDRGRNRFAGRRNAEKRYIDGTRTGIRK